MSRRVAKLPSRSAPADRAELREAMLAAAATILAEEGHAGLGLRHLADAVGTSTMAVYSLFGGKDGLIDALYVMAMEKLGAALLSIPDDPDPRIELNSLAAAYRSFAKTHPALYGIVAGQTIPHHRVPTNRLAVRPGLQTLKQVVERLLANHGAADRLSVAEVAASLWASLHGIVSLELAGQFDEQLADQLLRHNCGALGDHFFGRA